MHQDTFLLLQQADWGAIGKRLVRFVEYRARIYSWRSGSGTELAKGVTPEDIVQDVIKKTLLGDRKWDPCKGALEPWLKDQVKSEIDHLYRSAGNQHEIQSLDDPEDDELTVAVAAQASQVALLSSRPSAEAEVIIKEEQDNVRNQVDEILTILEDLPELQEIVFAVLDGCEPKPRYLGESLGIPVREVNNRLKRLRRLVLKEQSQ